MKTSKPFYKRFIFWIPILLLVLLATPSAIKIFELYIYSPQTEPAPEDFYVRGEELPFKGFEPLPKEEVEIINMEGGEKKVVENYKAGYSLTLPEDYSVGTWEVEGDTVGIGHNACSIDIESLYGRNENFAKTVKQYIEQDDWSYSTLLRIERVPNVQAEAYNVYYDGPFCFPGRSIYIQGKDRVFALGINNVQVNQDHDLTCSGGGCENEVETILNNLHFNEPVDGQ